MIDKNKIIDGLECCCNKDCRGCRYYRECRTDGTALMQDALKLIRAYEQSGGARLLTLEEVYDYSANMKPFYVEVHGEHSRCPGYAFGDRQAYCDKDMNAAQIIGFRTWRIGDPVYRAIKDYGKTWRCWTEKPTYEEREVTPWH